jgi:hypothetical protein
MAKRGGADWRKCKEWLVHLRQFEVNKNDKSMEALPGFKNVLRYVMNETILALLHNCKGRQPVYLHITIQVQCVAASQLVYILNRQMCVWLCVYFLICWRVLNVFCLEDLQRMTLTSNFVVMARRDRHVGHVRTR